MRPVLPNSNRTSPYKPEHPVSDEVWQQRPRRGTRPQSFLAFPWVNYAHSRLMPGVRFNLLPRSAQECHKYYTHGFKPCCPSTLNKFRYNDSTCTFSFFFLEFFFGIFCLHVSNKSRIHHQFQASALQAAVRQSIPVVSSTQQATHALTLIQNSPTGGVPSQQPAPTQPALMLPILQPAPPAPAASSVAPPSQPPTLPVSTTTAVPPVVQQPSSFVHLGPFQQAPAAPSVPLGTQHMPPPAAQILNMATGVATVAQHNECT